MVDMNTSRRGFLGMLAGAVLAKVVGPKVLVQPTEPIWKQALSLSPKATPVETFMPLEVMAQKVLEVVDREIKWLRLDRFDTNDVGIGWRDWYRGDTVVLRPPQRFVAQLQDDEPWPRPLIERLVPVQLMYNAGADLAMDPLRDNPTLEQFTKAYIEPTGYAMAERIIDAVRAHGGAGAMVTVPCQIPGGVIRSVDARNSEARLSLRAIEDYHPGFDRRITRFDILFGLA